MAEPLMDDALVDGKEAERERAGGYVDGSGGTKMKAVF